MITDPRSGVALYRGTGHVRGGEPEEARRKEKKDRKRR